MAGTGGCMVFVWTFIWNYDIMNQQKKYGGRSMNRKILVTIPFNDGQKEKIKAGAPEADITFMPMKDVTEEIACGAEVIMGNVDPALFKNSENLRWIQLNSAGADAYCKAGVLREEQILTCSSGAYDISVSENMVAYTLTMMKKLYSYYDNQKKHTWRDEGDVMSAWQSRIVVVGLGKIGLAYARRMKAMGSYVIGVKKHAGPAPEGVDEVYTMDCLQECLSQADVVACVLPGTPQTKGMMGKEQFAAMKKTAYFINTGRGDAVDLEALCDAVEQGEIAGAALDVMSPEPLPEDHRAWEIPGLFITPHIAGKFHIPVTLEIIADICGENLRRYLAGEELTHVVNREMGY